MTNETQVNCALHLIYASDEIDAAIKLCPDAKLRSGLTKISNLLAGVAREVAALENEAAFKE